MHYAVSNAPLSKTAKVKVKVNATFAQRHPTGGLLSVAPLYPTTPFEALD